MGWLMLRLRRWVNDPHIEIVLSILTPFIAYWPPEHLGGSGVLATVATGLHVSWYGPMIISATTRIQGVFFWDFFIYVIEGMVFLITGLQARTLIDRIGDYSMFELAISAVVVSAVVITARFVWMYPATYLPRWLFPPLKRRDPSPSWRWPFLLAFTGVRGIVSLAAALAIPLATVNGQPFPYRDLILFLTFAVILVTLVGQGLMLPWVIRALGLAHVDAGNATRKEPRSTLLGDRRSRQRSRGSTSLRRNELSEEIVQPIRSNHYDRLKHIKNRGDSDDSHRRHIELRDEIELLLLAAERQKINELFRSGRLKDETRRRIERELDVREAHLNQRAED